MFKLSSAVFAIATLSSFSAWAAPTPAQLSITSWRQTNPQTPADTTAEVCGTVTGTLTGQEHILITVDPGNNAGEYTTLLSPSGNFCQVVSSFTGQVQAALVGAGSTVLATTHYQARR